MLRCCACGGFLILLGIWGLPPRFKSRMGRIAHFRCRDCGLDQFRNHDECPAGTLD